jgi:Mlc titration factor MtfA (ptsG expression regulator)
LGALVLAWDAAKRGAANSPDGRNLVLHEFAHQLDFEDHATDGTPVLAKRSDYAMWQRVMSREFNALRAADDTGRPTVLDPYGATNPAEFFAVATETFFERPCELLAGHPELYGELKRFYCQDPARHFAGFVTL